MRKSTGTWILLIIIFLIAFLTACKKETGKQSDTKETDAKAISAPAKTDEERSVTSATGPVLSSEQIKKEMIRRSLLSVGNNYRLKKVMEKAKRGEDVTIAYIGGSITEGYNAGTKNNFAKLTYEYFADTYGSRDKIHMVNAGMSGTPSSLGLIRSDRDIFAYKPDIIFIEFAVNDAQSGIDHSTFESLVAKSMKQENEPAVILLFSVTEVEYTCQTQMALTGFRYQLPMISVMNALKPELDAGRMVWKDWSNDDVHPNEYGHQLYSDFIIHYFKAVDQAKSDEPAELPKRLVLGNNFTDLMLCDKTNTEVVDPGSFQEEAAHEKFTNGWVKSQGTGDNKCIKFKIKAKSLFVVYKEVHDDTYGKAEVSVDGKIVTSIESNVEDGWGKPQTSFIFSNKESEEHIVEIKMAAEDEDKAFAILAFGECR